MACTRSFPPGNGHEPGQMVTMNYRKALLGIGIAVPLLLALLAAGILWRISEQQYVAMTNLGLRLKVLRQSLSEQRQPGQESRPSWKAIWKPMITAMQFDAKHALMGQQGMHLSRPMHEQLSRFSAAAIDSDADLKDTLSRLDLSEGVMEARLPIVFSESERLTALSSVDRFHQEISGILSSEAAYTDWLSPILQQQRSLDRSVICKTQVEIEAFQAFADTLQSKCASTKNKWTACGGKNESINRQMKELQTSLETSLAKFKSRWSVKDAGNLCSPSWPA